MDKSEINVNRWVDVRLASLDPGSHWRPNATRGLARLKARKVLQFRFVWASAVAAAALCVGFLLLMAQPACASPYCVGFLKATATPGARQVPGTAVVPVAATGVVQPRPVIVPAVPVAAARPEKPPQRDAATATAKPLLNFKESGSPNARITCEIYSDYECPMCAVLFRDLVPLLVNEFVQTGKMKLVHRDFPLPQHPYARMAARYANAAGELGYYDVVVAQIFRTQDIWNKNGDIDTQVAQVLPPGLMQKVRQMVKSDPSLDATVALDVAMGQRDELKQTPTLVIVGNGKRQALPGVPSYNILKAYLDQLLGSH